MPSKATKKARRLAGGKKGYEPQTVKDDGSRWVIRNEETNRLVYGGSPIIKSEAERLVASLVAPSRMECVKEADS